MTPATQKTEQRIKDLADIMDKPITELLTPLEITETAEMNIQQKTKYIYLLGILMTGRYHHMIII